MAEASATTLTAQPRDGRGKGVARKLRVEGLIPAVVYGRVVEAQSIQLSPKSLMAILAGEYGINTIFTLDIQDENGASTATYKVTLKEFERHPVKRNLLHVDLFVVEDDRKLVVDVPIRLVGIPKGRKAGGQLKQLRRTIRATCLPADLPVAIEFDVTPLKIKQRALASQITPPNGVELMIDNDFAIAQVSVPRGTVVVDDDDEEEAAAAEGEGEAAPPAA